MYWRKYNVVEAITNLVSNMFSITEMICFSQHTHKQYIKTYNRC